MSTVRAPLKIEQVYTTACETLYRVEDNGVVNTFWLWCIVGGQLAVSFDDHYFTERFNVWPIGTGEYLVDHYDGQERKQSPLGVSYYQGPQISDLTGGEATFLRYYQRVMALRAKRDERLSAIHAIIGGQNKLESPRYHDTKDRLYFRCTWMIAYHYVGRSFYRTAEEHSVAEDPVRIETYGSPAWAEFYKFMRNPPGETWEHIPADKFETLLALLRAIVA